MSYRYFIVFLGDEVFFFFFFLPVFMSMCVEIQVIAQTSVSFSAIMCVLEKLL